jgi:adenylosuccinate synthase
VGKLQVIVGGQFGSEAKGAVAAHLARTEEKHVMAIRIGGPNAGHTAYDEQGQRHALRQLPVAAVVPHRSISEPILAIGAGSEVDMDVLAAEIREVQAIRDPWLVIDSQATILNNAHAEQEEHDRLRDRIGSTSKGIGAARAARLMRTAHLFDRDTEVGAPPEYKMADGVNVAHYAIQHMLAGGTVQIEGTQGFGLGLHAGYYPFCTSGDCRAVDFLAQAGLSPWHPAVTEFEVWIVYRPFPIRVAGNSGPLLGETTWAALGLPEERTTVTNKVRRVGAWDEKLAQQAMIANGGTTPAVHLALTMFDHVAPDVIGTTDERDLLPQDFMTLRQYERPLGRAFELIGTGPQTMIDRRGE